MVYDIRPDECRTYQCMWSQMDLVAEALRPDRCGIIFDRIADDVIVARLEEGFKLDGHLLGQINAFIAEGFSVLIFRGRENKYFLNEKHSQDYVRGVVHDRA